MADWSQTFPVKPRTDTPARPSGGGVVGAGSGVDAGPNPGRTIRTVDPRNRDDRPAPPRTLPIDSAQNPTAPAPQGALPDPYANPR